MTARLLRLGRQAARNLGVSPSFYGPFLAAYFFARIMLDKSADEEAEHEEVTH